MIADITSQLYLEVNEAFERITGYRRDEIVGRSWFQLCLFGDPHEWDSALQRLLNEGRIRNLEFGFS